MKIDRVSITLALFIIFSIAAIIYTIAIGKKKPPIPDIPVVIDTYSNPKINDIVTFNKSYYSLNPETSSSKL